MKFYIASSSHQRACILARALQMYGHGLTCRWIQYGLTGPQFDIERTTVAIQDLHDVEAADALILLADSDMCPGGKHVETGYAMALKKPVYVVGRRENIFHWHPGVVVYESEEKFLAMLGVDDPFVNPD